MYSTSFFLCIFQLGQKMGYGAKVVKDLGQGPDMAVGLKLLTLKFSTFSRYLYTKRHHFEQLRIKSHIWEPTWATWKLWGFNY